MSLRERVLASPMKYSEQALFLIEAMKDDFPLEEFEQWVQENCFSVGGGYVIEFLKARAQALPVIEETPVEEVIPQEEPQADPIPEPTEEELEAKHLEEKYFGSAIPTALIEEIKEEVREETPLDPITEENHA